MERSTRNNLFTLIFIIIILFQSVIITRASFVNEDVIKILDKITNINVSADKLNQPSVSFVIDNNEYKLQNNTNKAIKLFITSLMIEKFITKKLAVIQSYLTIIEYEKAKKIENNNLLEYMMKKYNESIKELDINGQIIEKIISTYKTLEAIKPQDGVNSIRKKIFFIGDENYINIIKKGKATYVYDDTMIADTNIKTNNINNPVFSYDERKYLLELLLGQSGKRNDIKIIKAIIVCLDYLLTKSEILT